MHRITCHIFLLSSMYFFCCFLSLFPYLGDFFSCCCCFCCSCVLWLLSLLIFIFFFSYASFEDIAKTANVLSRTNENCCYFFSLNSFEQRRQWGRLKEKKHITIEFEMDARLQSYSFNGVVVLCAFECCLSSVFFLFNREVLCIHIDICSNSELQLEHRKLCWRIHTHKHIQTFACVKNRCDILFINR